MFYFHAQHSPNYEKPHTCNVKTSKSKLQLLYTVNVLYFANSIHNFDDLILFSVLYLYTLSNISLVLYALSICFKHV